MQNQDFLHLPDGIRLRHTCWKTSTGAFRGDLLLLGGRTEFLEKYDETARELNLRGYDVYSFDWRGQGLSTRELPDRRKGYVRRFEDYLSDLSQFVERVLRPGVDSRFSILAHSMGGNVALRYLRQTPDHVDRAVLVSSMMRIFSTRGRQRLALSASAAACRLGLGRAVLPGSGGFDTGMLAFAGNVYTSDRRRFERTMAWIRKNPDLAMSGATWRWLHASCRSVEEVQRPGFAENIRTPILFVGGGAERVVSLSAQREMARRLPNGSFCRIEGARHEILMENDELRKAMWRRVDDFLGTGSP